MNDWNGSGSDYCTWSPSEPNNWRHENRRVRSFEINSLPFVNTTFPSAILELTELEILYIISIEGLYGQIPFSIGNLRQLKTLVISYTSLSGPIPSSLAQITNLTELVMPHNKLSGSIPKSLSKLKYLYSIYLSSNQLTGPIPPKWGHGSPENLITLDLSFNDLSGAVPKYYGSPYFSSIIFKNNRLSGDPSFLFGKEKETFEIDLSNNNFEFDLSHIEVPSKLNVLYLSHNRIFISIPQSVENIRLIDLSNNQLCGPIPTGDYSWQHTTEVYANNTCLCGGPLPPCCD